MDMRLYNTAAMYDLMGYSPPISLNVTEGENRTCISTRHDESDFPQRLHGSCSSRILSAIQTPSTEYKGLVSMVDVDGDWLTAPLTKINASENVSGDIMRGEASELAMKFSRALMIFLEPSLPNRLLRSTGPEVSNAFKVDRRVVCESENEYA